MSPMIANKLVKRYFILLTFFVSGYSAWAQPQADFSANIQFGCAPLLVNFKDLSTGSPTEWHWDLGDGTTSALQNPSISYFTSGKYTIKLIVKNNQGSDTLIKTAYITVHALPIVDFSGAPTLTGCKVLPVQYTDLSTPGDGFIDLWQWDFGDGTIGYAQHPYHVYNSPGNFNVTLQVRNSFGCTKTLLKSNYIKVGAGVTADFSNPQPIDCSVPALIDFTNLSTGPDVLSYAWDFGDGTTSTLQNPSHNYTTAGHYTVKLITKSTSGCTDSIIRPKAAIVGIAAPTFSCANQVCVDLPLDITNTTAPAPASVKWDFGDGTTDIALNPKKVYSVPGVYKIKLISQTGDCVDSTTKTITVLDKPKTDFTADNLIGCKAPHTVNFKSTSNNAVSYLWNFGDGLTSSLQNPTHIYDTAGVYNVTLISTNANGCVSVIEKPKFIQVQWAHASIDNKPDSGCAPFAKKFTATITTLDPITNYLWDFGDGTTSSLAEPDHVFSPGVYTIKLIITTSKGCKDTATLVNGIISTEKPTVNFVADPLNVCAQFPVHFTDLSSDNVTKWLWKFGDYDTSTLQNPVHIYKDTGYMTVNLTVWNRGCSNTVTFSNYLYIKPPIARFNYGYSCTDPYIKYFYQYSIGADEWHWDFGDGTTSDEKNPVHSYPAKGNYVVTLTVKNYTTGCSYATKRTVQVIIEKPDFIASDSIICKNTQVSFTPKGMNASNIRYYYWDFGDGVKDTSKLVSHVFANAGNYTVQLIVVNRLWCRDTIIKPLYIKVNGPTAKFTTDLPGSCLLSAVTFNDKSSDDGVHAIINWKWDFGDSTIISASGPPFQHTYAAPGVYPVSLKVTDNNGCTDSFNLVAPLIISKPIAKFAATTTLTCPGKNIAFKDSSTGPALKYKWDFGDGTSSAVANPVHQYLKDGVYSIKLMITDQFGCTDSMIKPNYITVVSPKADFSISDSIGTCPPLVVDFKNSSTNFVKIKWDFGDGTSTNTDNPSHFYSNPGVYFAKLTITSPGGCIDTLSKKITVLGPSGSFKYLPFIGCAPTQVNFESTTSNTASFIWDFNDGTVVNSAASMISHTYTVKGTYLPKMILVDANGCQVPVIGLDTIQIKDIQADFSFADKVLCDAGTVQFYDSTSTNDVISKYEWDFGDGSIATGKNPAHLYTSPGLYQPRLIVTTINGCADTVSYPKLIKVVASPQIQIASTANGCAPLNVTFNGQLLAQDTSALSWQWNFANGNTSNLVNPPAQLYSNASAYQVKLTVTNSSGCMATVTKNIEAFAIPDVNAGADKLICLGKNTALTAQGADTYSWSPAAGLNCTDCSHPTASPTDTLTNYIVTGTTVHGCISSDTVQVKVKYPFTMKSSRIDTLCDGSTKKLFASGAYSYSWSPATGLNATNIPNPVANPHTSITYTVVGTDEIGCFKDTNYIPIAVYPMPTVNIGEDQTINVGQTANIQATYSSDVTKVFWIPQPGIVSSTNNSLIVKPKETTEYSIEVKNEAGCKAVDKMTVFVVCNGANVFIPNTFSPNDDGVNDRFYPRGTGLFNIKTFRIFNRWGEIVFEKNNFTPNDANSGWDGRYKGMKLTPDVYVYTVEISCDNKSTLVFKGNITLIQ